MQKRNFLLSIFAAVLFSPGLFAEASITTFYDKNAAQKKLDFRCIAKGLETGKKYMVAVGTVSSIALKGTVEVPQGAKVETEQKSYVEKDIARINAGIKELKAEGFRLTVQELSPEAEIKYRFEISYQDMEKLKADQSPLYLFISREFSPNLYYIVDYYELQPANLLK